MCTLRAKKSTVSIGERQQRYKEMSESVLQFQTLELNDNYGINTTQ
jgi:hypothetical protein